MQIEYSKKFMKEFKKCPNAIKTNFKVKLQIFIDNRYHPILNNHPLFGKLKGCRSLNISGDWRAIFAYIDNDKITYFVAIGTHSQLYC